jgi:hypothetical protein
MYQTVQLYDRYEKHLNIISKMKHYCKYGFKFEVLSYFHFLILEWCTLII